MPRERPKHHYRLSPDNILTKPKLIVIASEGNETEYKYFTELQKKYHTQFFEQNVHVEILRRPKEQDGYSAPQHVEEMLDNFLKDNDYNIQEYDEFWVIIDTDENPLKLKEIFNKFNQKSSFYLGFSNPCFEIWLILHLTDSNEKIEIFWSDDITNTPLIKRCIENNGDYSVKECIESIKTKKRPRACKQLNQIIKNYYKLGSIEDYFDHTNEAISRAKNLEECNPNSNNYPKYICTNLYELIEKLSIK